MAFEEALFDKRGAGLGVVGRYEDDMTGCVAVGWFAVVVLVSAAAGLSLPSLQVSHDDPATVDEVLRLDWLIVATFVTYAIRRCCEARIWLGTLATVAACLQSFYVVDTAMDRVEEYCISAPSMVVSRAVPAFQLVCFTAFALAGSRRRLAEPRWQRLTTKLMQNSPTSRPVRH